MRNLTLKSILIAVVIAACGGFLYTNGLNPAIDLAGGTSLLYKVDTAGADNPEELIMQTIQVLQQRVDPNGVMNLVWRVDTGGRIEIQMPLAGEGAQEAREKYQELLRSFEDQAITRTEVQAALRAEGEQRQKLLAQLGRGIGPREQALREAALAYDELQAGRQGLNAAQEGTDQYIEIAGQVARAEIAYEEALAAVDRTNLSPAEVNRVLELSTVAKGGQSSPRKVALERMFADHPDRAEQLKALIAAYDVYQTEKGPLDDPQDLIRLLKGAGVLEFRIVAPPADPQVAQMRSRLRERGPRSVAADSPMKWYIVDDIAAWADNPRELAAAQEDAAGYFASRGLVAEEYDGEIYILLWDTPGKSITQRDEGWQLTSASRIPDDKGLPAIGFNLNERGGQLMGDLTSANIEQQMAIVLDDRVYSAPVIQSRIAGSGSISTSGGFSQTEQNYLVRTLGGGALKARLSEEPVSVRVISPTLGADNLQRGLKSAYYAFIAVVIFMMIYYFFGGFVADLALAANVIVILGVMAMQGATFTLPGIAGIVLTIGMCVDANVLIFERIREELKRGANMSTALRLGYDKAMSAIIDGNLTNLIVCFILYYTATADVKGFAVTLGIGIVATLFTSVWMSRVIFEIWHRAFPRQKLNMLPIAVPAIDRFLTPNIDWYGLRKIFYGISAVILTSSIIFCIARGENLLDIEFRAGTEVAFNLTEGRQMELTEARQRVAETGLPDAQVIPVNAEDPLRSNEFSVLTTETDPDVVSAKIREAFAGVLDVQPVLSFRGVEAELAEAPVYPITRDNLGQVINRPAVEDRVGDYLGGAAIVLDNLQPTDTLEDIEARLRFMRAQPDYRDVQIRRPRVVGLQPDPANPGRWSSVAVLVNDEQVSYFEDPATWESAVAATEWQLVRDALTRETSFSKVSNFDASVARTMTNQAIVAMLLSVIAIIIYMWFRFQSLRYGIVASLALIHDVIFTLGFVAASAYVADTWFGHLLLIDPFKINMAMIAALLTLVGYSLNDTIVIFDRIREVRGKLGYATPQIINEAINLTMSRTAMTSSTTFLAIVFMYFLGGPGAHGFAFAMTIGVIVGTYSTVAIAAPMLLIGARWAGQTAPAKRPEGGGEPVRA